MAQRTFFSKEGVDEMKSPIVKRSTVVDGHKTSVSLEKAFWDSVKEISRGRGQTQSELISEIDRNREQNNLSSAIRLFVLDHYRNGSSAQPLMTSRLESHRIQPEHPSRREEGDETSLGH